MTGGYLPLMSTLNAARVVDRAAALLGTDLAGVSDLALAAGQTQGPVLVPFLDGERTPDRPNARGGILDVSSSTTREELARAFVEGPLLLTASLQLTAEPITDAGIGRLVRHLGPISLRAWVLIHLQALRIVSKGIRYIPPLPQPEEETT